MNALESLRSNLGAESKAYGYTLSIWGSGAMLVAEYGTPEPIQVFFYILGGVLGFGFLALIAFHGVFKSVRYDHEEIYIVASIIHILASLGNVALSYLFILLLTGSMSAFWVAFVIGFHASFSYNILLLIESYLSEKMMHWEMRVLRFFR